jgi:hypothetical protein
VLLASRQIPGRGADRIDTAGVWVRGASSTTRNARIGRSSSGPVFVLSRLLNESNEWFFVSRRDHQLGV